MFGGKMTGSLILRSLACIAQLFSVSYTGDKAVHWEMETVKFRQLRCFGFWVCSVGEHFSGYCIPVRFNHERIRCSVEFGWAAPHFIWDRERCGRSIWLVTVRFGCTLTFNQPFYSQIREHFLNAFWTVHHSTNLYQSPTQRTISPFLIIYITLYSSTCFEHRCAHLQEERKLHVYSIWYRHTL